MVHASSSQIFTEQKRFIPYCCWMRTHIPFAKVHWKNTICPHCCWMIRTSWAWKFTERIRFTPLNGTYVTNTKVYWKNTVCPTLLLNDTYIANTKVYWKNTAVAEWYIPREHEVLRSALHVAMCVAMSMPPLPSFIILMTLLFTNAMDKVYRRWPTGCRRITCRRSFLFCSLSCISDWLIDWEGPKREIRCDH